jgi:hypothetical protein
MRLIRVLVLFAVLLAGSLSSGIVASGDTSYVDTPQTPCDLDDPGIT